MKKLKKPGIEFWSATIIGSIIIGFSLQTLIFSASTYLIEKVDNVEGGFGANTNFLWNQVITALIGVLAGLVFFVLRKPKK